MIYIIDTIGNETGMHLYDESFIDKLKECGGTAYVISNYKKGNDCPSLHNYYRGKRAIRIAGVAIDILKLHIFSLHHKDDIFIYQSFGLRVLDMLFFSIFLKRRNSFLLVHDLYEFRTAGNGDSRMALKQKFYARCPNFICHSRAVEKDLLDLRRDESVRVIYLPHVEYTYSTDYDLKKVGYDVKDSVDRNKTNILFFGQLCLTKGIDRLLKDWEHIPSDFNLIIAGRDKNGLLIDYNPLPNVKKIIRYIENDELNYLFSSVDAVVLPYREIYQSGVLETVVHFRKPALLSDIAPFAEYLKRYPSFGILLDNENLASSLEHLLKNKFYSHEDLKRYKDDHSFVELFDVLKSVA